LHFGDYITHPAASTESNMKTGSPLIIACLPVKYRETNQWRGVHKPRAIFILSPAQTAGLPE